MTICATIPEITCPWHGLLFLSSLSRRFSELRVQRHFFEISVIQTTGFTEHGAYL